MRRGLAAALLAVVFAGAVLAAEPPLRVRFETGGALPKLNSSVPLTVVVERSAEPKSEPPAICVRVPIGIKLTGENWKAQPAPEKKDPNEEDPVWTVFNWTGPLEWQQESSDRATARVPLFLEMTEQGTNWVITARAQNGKAHAECVILATLQAEIAAFHSAPFKNPLPVDAYYAPDNAKKKKNAEKNGY